MKEAPQDTIEIDDRQVLIAITKHLERTHGVELPLPYDSAADLRVTTGTRVINLTVWKGQFTIQGNYRVHTKDKKRSWRRLGSLKMPLEDPQLFNHIDEAFTKIMKGERLEPQKHA